MQKIKQRTWLIKAREALGMEREDFAHACDCSDELMYLLEETGTYTHPQIAATIARFLGGDVERYNDLVHESHRAKVIPKPYKTKSTTTYSRVPGV